VLHIPAAKVERGLGFRLVEAGRRAADDDGSASIATKTLLQYPSQFRVSVRYVGLVAVGECRDDVSQCAQRLVDVLGFIKHSTFRTCLAHLNIEYEM
jgi:hypothetical protein